MVQDQNALSPTALVWDRNGELCSEDFERLLERLQGTGSQFPVLGGPLITGAEHATSGPHPIATSRLGTHRENRRVRCSPW